MNSAIAVMFAALLVTASFVGPVGAALVTDEASPARVGASTTTVNSLGGSGGSTGDVSGTLSGSPSMSTDQFSWPTLGSDDWGTAGRDPGRTGYNPNVSAPKTAPEARWMYEFANDDWAVPTVASDGYVFVAGYESLRAVDNETGEEGWTVTGIDNYDEISAADGVVVTTESGFSGEVHAYDAADGTEIWNETSFDADASVILDGTLYVSRGEYLHAFDLQTGTEQWNVRTDEDISLALSAAGDTVYAAGQVNNRDYAVYALHANDGSERWRFEMEGPISMHPVVSNGSVYVGAGTEPRDGSPADFDPKFYRLNGTDGHIEWAFDVNTRPHGAAVAGDSVYLAAGNTIHAIDIASGDHQWRHRLSASLDHGLSYSRTDALAPAVADGVVYAVNTRGHLVALDAQSGDEQWQYALDGVATSPAIADDRLYVLVTDTDSVEPDYTRVYALEETPFAFSGFAPSKQTVEPGEQFTVDVAVENVDDEIRRYNLSLRAELPYPRGDPVIDRQNGTLAPGAMTTLTFTTTLHSAASWNLSVQRLRETEPSVGPVTVDVTHPSPDDLWSMDGFDANRSDANPNTDGPTQHFQQAWNVSFVDEDTTPVIDNDTVYAIRHQNRYNGQPDVHAVSALDLNTGSQHWEYNFTADNRVPSGSPAVVNDTVYVVTTPFEFDPDGPSIQHGSVYAFDANNGARTWKTSVSINKSAQYDHGPVVANGLVYTAGAIYEQNDYYVDASVVALDARTGGTVWSNGMADRSEQESYGTYALGDQQLFVTASNQVEGVSSEYHDDLHAYDAASGSLTWTTSPLDLVVDHHETPVVANGLVFVVNESDYFTGEPGEELVAINVSTGAEEWRFTPSNIPNSYGGEDDGWRLTKPAVSDGSLYVRQRSSSDPTYARLHRVDLATGDAIWNRSTNYLQHVQVVDGVVYGAETEFSSGYIRLYDAETGEKHGDSYGRISVAVANGTVLTYEPEDDRMEAVVEGGVIEFTDLSVDTHDIGERENVTVTATATNVGSLPRKYTVNLDVAPDDHADRYFWDNAERQGLLAPGESTTLTWNVRLDTRGDFVFVLRPSVPNNGLDHYALDNAGSVTVHVGDDRDGTVIDLGGPRTLAPDTNSWPKQSFDAGNTGNNSGTAAPTAVGSNTTAWAVNHSSEWTSGPTVANDTIFVGGYDGGDDSIYAFNATDGSLRWQYATPTDVEITPTYAGGYLYTADGRERVYQFDATTGERLWTFHAGTGIDGITVVDDVAYIAGSDYVDSSDVGIVRALNATTREVLWTFERGDSSAGMAVTPAVVDGTVYTTSSGNRTYAVDVATGQEVWNRSIAGQSSRLHSPVVADGVVYVDDATYGGTDGRLYALDATDGSTIWNVAANVDGYRGSSPALAHDTLFFTADGSIQAINATDGNQMWSNQICVAAEHSPVYADGVVFVPMEDSTVRAYDADTGELVWRYDAYYGESFTPAVVDGVLYSAGLEYDVYDDPYPLLALTGGQTNQTTPIWEYSGLSVSSTNVSEGEQFTVSATVENRGDSACTYAADFLVDGAVDDTATDSVSGGRSETISFTHSFATEGTYNVTIEDLPPVDVNVTPPQPDVDVTPSSGDYGDIDVDDMVYMDFEVRNLGQGDLHWSDSVLTGPDADEFSITSDDSETYAYLWWGGSGYVRVYLTPDSAGSKSATLEIHSDDPDQPVFSVPLTATVLGDPEVDVSPTSVDLGDVAVGNTFTANVTVSNVGGGPLSFEGGQLGGASGSAYQIVDGNGATTIAAGDSHDVTVAFTPTTTGTAAATLELSTDDADESVVSVSLVGNGTIDAPNRPPVVAADHYVVYEGEWLNVSGPGVVANDLDPDGDDFDATHYGTPSHGSVESFYGSGGFNYTADDGFTGIDSFTYRVRDGEGAYSAYGTVTIEVLSKPNRAPNATADHYSVHVGEWLNVSADGVLDNDRDADGDHVNTKYHGNPSNGDLHKFYVSGGFEYRADSWQTGTETFTYWIEDEHGETDYATVTIEVLPPRNRAPTGVKDHYTVSQGEWLNVSDPGVTDNDWDIDGDAISTKYHGNPSNGDLHRFYGSGGFEYRPDPGFTGTDSFAYWIEDEHGETAYTTVTIEVANDNRAPTPIDDHYAVLEGEWLNVSGPGVLDNDYDLDNDSISTKYYGNPSNGELYHFYGSGGFEYKPDPGFTGTDSFTYWIEDEHGEEGSGGTVTVEVIDPNGTEPVAIDDFYTVYENEWLNVSGPGVLENDRDPRGHSIDTKYHGNPENGTLHRFYGSGGFEYKPDAGFTGTDSFAYWIKNINGTESRFATVTVEVLPDPDTTGNRAPTPIDDTYTVVEGNWLNISGPGVLDNDWDADNDSVSTKYYGNPSNGDLHRFYGSGGFEYKPASGFTGTDSFTYWIEDEHGEEGSGGTVTVEVVPDPNANGNRPPEIVDDAYVVYENEWLNVSGPGVLDNDRDADGDAISTKYHGNPSNGDLPWFYGSGGFKYKPASGFTGTDSFTYWIEDEHGEEGPGGTVTIEVLPDPNRAPETVPDDYVVIQGETLTVEQAGVLTNDYDLDGDAINTKYHGNPSNGNLHRFYGSGGFEYTPDPGFVGVDSFTYWIEDEHGAQAGGGQVTITVVNATTTQYADVAIPSDGIDFGGVSAGQTATETITVANVGHQNLTVSAATVSGPNATEFTVEGDATATLGYGGTETISVEFAPTRPGEYEATLTVSTDDPDEPTVALPLTGTGFDRTDPTIRAVNVTGSYRNDTDPNGSLVYENETVAFEVNASDAYGTVEDVRIALDARTSSDTVSKFATADATTGNWTSAIDVGSLTEGKYEIRVRAYDSSGNRRDVTLNDTVGVDRAIPTLAASVTRVNATHANVTVRANEDLRPGTLSVEVDGPGPLKTPTVVGTGDAWNGTFELDGDGRYNLSATALDLAGNRGSDTATARFVTTNTTNNTVTVEMQPSGLFVKFNTDRSVNDTYISMTETKVPVAPLVRGQAGLQFLDAALGKQLEENLTYATIGIPVDSSLLTNGATEDDVTIRYFNETRKQWTKIPTTVENVTVNGTTREYWVADVTHFSTYGAVSSDTSPPSFTSTDPADGTALTAGTTTTVLRVEFEDASSGIDASETVVRFDGTPMTGDSATSITSDAVEYTASGLTDGSSHELEVRIEDRAGNVNTETISFTVASSGGSTTSGGTSTPSSGTSGRSAGSDGDGDSSPSIGVVRPDRERILLEVRGADTGESISTTLDNGSLGSTGVIVSRLSFVFETPGDRDLVVTGETQPTDVTRPSHPGDALAYVTISDDGVVTATIRFTVTNEALGDRDADADDVSLYRLRDGEWMPVDISTATVTADGPVFEATDSNLGTFVVVTRDATTTTQAATAESTTATESTTTTESSETTEPTTASTSPSPTTTSTSDMPGFGIGVTVFALIVGVGWFYRRHGDR